MPAPLRVAAIGCGDIFRKAYVPGIRACPGLALVACADQDAARARAAAQEFGIPFGGTSEEVLARADVDLVLNLTVPQAHAPVALAALRAGKHVYGEKPLALSTAEAAPVLALARERGLQVGCAPDTVLGAGIQTARAAIDAGLIGRPVAATAVMACHGHEHWHPSPAFYYQRGGGPLLDMGPYYLTALATLLGPARRACAMSGRAFAEREISSKPLAGTRVPVEIETHVAGQLAYDGGAIASIVMSFDTWKHSLPCIEIHGTEGSLSVPDPNGFGGAVRLARRRGDWEELPHRHPENRRGIGVADLADAIASGRAARCSGELAFHVLDTMESLLAAAANGRTVEIASPGLRPAALPAGLAAGLAS